MIVLFIIGRIILGGYFIYNAYRHFTKVGSMAQYAASKEVPAPKAAVIISGILLLIGGISIVLGAYPYIGLIALIIFLIPVSFKMHDFWAIPDPGVRAGQMVNFGKNMAILGAVLMMFIISRPWPWSVMR